MISYFDRFTNLFPDPGFEGGVLTSTEWRLASGALDTTEVKQGGRLAGGYSLCTSAAAVAGAAGDVVVEHGWLFPAVELTAYSAACVAGFVTAGLFARMTLEFYDASQNFLASATVDGTPGVVDAEDLELENVTSPALAAIGVVRLGAYLEDTGVDGQAMWDDVVVAALSEVPPPFDGESGNAYWTGPPHRSAVAREGEADEMLYLRRMVPPYYLYEEDLT